MRAAVIAAVLVVLLGGYAVADATDVVPGVLTTAPLPRPPGPPPVPGASAQPSPVTALPALTPDAPRPTTAALSAALTPLLAAPALGGSVGVSVLDARSGAVLLDVGAGVPRQPASVAKLLTAAAVLARFGPDARLTTKVVTPAAPVAGQPTPIVLVGGGDVLLGAGQGRPSAVDGHAGLDDLAASAAAALRAKGAAAVTLALDDTLVGSAPALDPTWGSGDVAGGYVAPLASLAVDAGRTAAGRYAPRSPDPAMAAATTFAAALAAHGISVSGAPTRTSDPVAAGAGQLAAVTSAPLGDVLAYTLAESDNTVAESLARQVGHAAGAPPTFAASAAAVLATDARAGLDVSGVTLVDGSGLGAGSSVPPRVLSGLLAAAAGPGHPALRPLLAELGVAGLSGTLAERFTSGSTDAAGAGLVRAKTGTLTGVNSLAGTVVDADGRQLAFAVLADHVGATDPAREAVDAVVEALAGCGCR